MLDKLQVHELEALDRHDGTVIRELPFGDGWEMRKPGCMPATLPGQSIEQLIASGLVSVDAGDNFRYTKLALTAAGRAAPIDNGGYGG